MKCFLKIGFSIVFALSVLTGCASSGDSAGKGSPWGAPPFTGTVTGTARGYAPGVEVTLTLVNGLITEVVLDLSRETAAFARTPGRDAPGMIIAMNSTNIDTIAAASETCRGIREAGKQALLKIPGVTDVGY